MQTAIAAYKAVDDGNTNDSLWYGWTVGASAVPEASWESDGDTGEGTLEQALVAVKASGGTIHAVTEMAISSLNSILKLEGGTYIGANEQPAIAIVVEGEASESEALAKLKDLLADGYKFETEDGFAVNTIEGDDGSELMLARTGNTAKVLPDSSVAVTDVSLNKSTLSLEAGKSETLTASIAPANATNKAVTWQSSDTTVATVTADGKLTAIKKGAASITVTTTDGSKTATCAVIVTATSSSIRPGGGGGGSGGSSPATKPTAPVQGNINTNATVDQNGNANVTVNDKNITEAIKAAKDEASKIGANAGELTVVINVATDGKDANTKMLRFATNHFSVYGIGYKAPVGFTDIEGHWAETDIAFVANRLLMRGTGNTIFTPNGSMTRGMFVTTLGRLADVDVNSYKTGKFTDVKTDAYYAPYVNWAAEKGITSGTSATTFSPDSTVTRQEMAVFMTGYAKAMGLKVPETREAVTFADNSSIASWAAAAVKQMQMAGTLSGREGNVFDPQGTATRAEVVAVLHRYMELIIDF